MSTMNASRRVGFLPLLLLCILTLILLSVSRTGAASQVADPLWEDIPETAALRQSPRRIVPRAYRLLRLNTERLDEILAQAPAEFSGQQGTELVLPMPDGTTGRFLIHNSPIMEPELADKFPEIQTFIGVGVDDPSATVRLGWTHKGFHATVRSVGRSSVYIDAYAVGDTTHYVSYRKSDYTTSAANMTVQADQVIDNPAVRKQLDAIIARGEAQLSGEQLRIYRLAVATTGEYTAFHGGTVNDALAEIVTAMNRVNGIYERDVAIRMVLIADNDQIIYTNANTDPYTNNNGVAMLGENQTNLDNVIGSANYDIGHVFSTGGGGIAALGSPCNNSIKAEGVTGLSSPTGDPFYVDYVAHELGHQWGATHTFNGNVGSCGGNRSGSTAYEPGSGTTIMGYAGICGSQNVQNNSDDYFHGASYDQMVAYSTQGTGSTCGTVQNTGNTPPEASAGNDFTIPADTPFVLTGMGSDSNGDDVLSYNWEQFTLGASGSLNNAAVPPHFRSFPSTAEPVRIFPQISDILNGTSTLGELLPSATDTLTFRLTVRDNRADGGGVDFDTMTLNVTDTAGPFAVTEPTGSSSWTGASSATVNWNVAGTDSAPVNCSQVDIALSTDGGNTFDQVLATAVPNDGSETVSVPNINSTQARVRVACNDNVFFNISTGNFDISEAVGPTFTMTVDPTDQNVCVPNNATIDISTEAVLGFSDLITLSAADEPAGTTAVFGQTVITPGQDTTLTVSNTGNATPDSYTITITGMAGVVERTATSSITLLPDTLAAPTLTQPANGAVSVSTSPMLTWSSVANATSYQLEVATDIAFANIVYSTTTTALEATPTTELASGVVHYWRVTAVGACAQESSAVFSFTTAVAPGVCAPSQETVIAFTDDFESGVGDWTSGGVQDTWTLAGDDPFSGSFGWYAENLGEESDQRLVSPAITVPTGDNVTLQFQNAQFFEPPDGDGRCYDGGILEISTDDGANWSYVPNSLISPDSDPYDNVFWDDISDNNPITVDYGVVNGWCDANQDYTNVVVDLTNYEGQTVRFRWRLGTDSFASAEGWYIDDVTVQACQTMPVYAVDSEANSMELTTGETTITHTVSLTNTGNVSDTYSLSISGETWATAVMPTSVQLDPSMSATVDVTVTVPSNIVGDFDTATLTITSQTDNSVSSTTALTTSVYDPFGLFLFAPVTSASAGAGSSVTYAVDVDNDTGITDTFLLEVTGTAAGSVVPTSVTLADGDSATVIVEITVPANASLDTDYVNTVTATPTNSLVDADQLSLTTTALAANFDIFLPILFRP